MIEVKDRIPTKPNRIRIVPETGDPFYAVWERADEPIEEGTPVNKYLFDSIDEGGHFPNALDDIEMDAQRVTLAAGWTTVSFRRPLSGVPRVFVSVSDTAVVAVKNITRTSCQIAVRLGALQEVYVSTSSGGTASTKVSVLSYPEFSAVTVDVLAIYDGGITV
ncbi:MAG: hypothetical protein EGQ60_08465 [Clostridiales bacterium]|nr:hypothetical protein [Clostridiales bacterium]